MFEFKQFTIADDHCGMKLSTDSVLLGAWANVPHGDASTALDLGAGSGVLSLMLAQRGMGRVVGMEIDEEACADARANASASPWPDSIDIVCADALLADLWDQSHRYFDLIISNPPFFTETLRSPDSARARARHADTLNPLSVLDFAIRHLAPGGSVAMIFPAKDLGDITFHGEMLGLKLRRRCLVSAVEGRAPIRALVQLCRKDGPVEQSSLAIRRADGCHTEAYRALTSDFYLDRAFKNA